MNSGSAAGGATTKRKTPSKAKNVRSSRATAKSKLESAHALDEEDKEDICPVCDSDCTCNVMLLGAIAVETAPQSEPIACEASPAPVQQDNTSSEQEPQPTAENTGKAGGYLLIGEITRIGDDEATVDYAEYYAETFTDDDDDDDDADDDDDDDRDSSLHQSRSSSLIIEIEDENNDADDEDMSVFGSPTDGIFEWPFGDAALSDDEETIYLYRMGWSTWDDQFMSYSEEEDDDGNTAQDRSGELASSYNNDSALANVRHCKKNIFDTVSLSSSDETVVESPRMNKASGTFSTYVPPARTDAGAALLSPWNQYGSVNARCGDTLAMLPCGGNDLYRAQHGPRSPTNSDGLDVDSSGTFGDFLTTCDNNGKKCARNCKVRHTKAGPKTCTCCSDTPGDAYCSRPEVKRKLYNDIKAGRCTDACCSVKRTRFGETATGPMKTEDVPMEILQAQVSFDELVDVTRLPNSLAASDSDADEAMVSCNVPRIQRLQSSGFRRPRRVSISQRALEGAIKRPNAVQVMLVPGVATTDLEGFDKDVYPDYKPYAVSTISFGGPLASIVISNASEFQSEYSFKGAPISSRSRRAWIGVPGLLPGQIGWTQAALPRVGSFDSSMSEDEPDTDNANGGDTDGQSDRAGSSQGHERRDELESSQSDRQARNGAPPSAETPRKKVDVDENRSTGETDAAESISHNTSTSIPEKIGHASSSGESNESKQPGNGLWQNGGSSTKKSAAAAGQSVTPRRSTRGVTRSAYEISPAPHTFGMLYAKENPDNDGFNATAATIFMNDTTQPPSACASPLCSPLFPSAPFPENADSFYL